ncbi:MAG: thioesterase family protein [Proteobacteria bacterium]|nr:thioesterase family protein [Pseudomonadota bacterium]
MAAGFPALLAAARPLADGLAAELGGDWAQGRTTYGGCSAALALAAAQRVGGADLPPLRSATVSFVGPLAGAVEARARVLRQGRNATWIGAEITGEGGVGLTASFVFMGAAGSTLELAGCAAPGDLVPFDQARDIPADAPIPTFLRANFAVRFARPPAPAPEAELCRWVRLEQGEGLDPMVEALLVGDAMPPAVLPLMQRGARVSSMTWQINLLTARPATRDHWWLLRSEGDYASGGCSSQRMGLWNADGVPVATGMQSIAVFD